MYRPSGRTQHPFLDFNHPMGLHMNPDNRWVRMADSPPWDEFETKYAGPFPSRTGNAAEPLRMALGALIIQTKFQYSDRELVEQSAENPYLQRFCGLPEGCAFRCQHAGAFPQTHYPEDDHDGERPFQER